MGWLIARSEVIFLVMASVVWLKRALKFKVGGVVFAVIKTVFNNGRDLIEFIGT